MNYKNASNSIKTFFSKCVSYVKIIRVLPHSGKYSALALFLIIIFTILTFPYDYLIRKKFHEIGNRTVRSISMKELDFSIIGESYANDLEIMLGNGQEISCKSIILNLSVNPYRIFISRRYIADFQFDQLKFNVGKSEIILNINGNIDITTDSEGKIPVSGDLKIILADAKLKMDNISIPGPFGPLSVKLDVIEIQNGIAEIDIVNSVARLKNLKLTGTDLNCSITGTVSLSEKTDNSNLDLIINIDPESAALEQYKDLITAATNNNPLVISVKGTIGRPDIKLAGTDKSE